MTLTNPNDYPITAQLQESAVITAAAKIAKTKTKPKPHRTTVAYAQTTIAAQGKATVKLRLSAAAQASLKGTTASQSRCGSVSARSATPQPSSLAPPHCAKAAAYRRKRDRFHKMRSPDAADNTPPPHDEEAPSDFRATAVRLSGGR